MDKQILCKRWVHSHEEDTENEKVFRTADYNFPRSRGRKSFELKPGGELIYMGLSPTDKQEPVIYKWELKNDDLIFYISTTSEPLEILHIVSVDDDRLIIKK